MNRREHRERRELLSERFSLDSSFSPLFFTTTKKGLLGVLGGSNWFSVVSVVAASKSCTVTKKGAKWEIRTIGPFLDYWRSVRNRTKRVVATLEPVTGDSH